VLWPDGGAPRSPVTYQRHIIETEPDEIGISALLSGRTNTG
jgi:hypothetical protein